MIDFIGASPIMERISEKIDHFSRNDLPIFVTGATGTGKEVTARAIHEQSARSDKPFIAINCASLSKEFYHSELFGHVKGSYTGADKSRNGAVIEAQGGTLFLDEISELSPQLQATLLRFTQDYTFKKLGSDIILKADIRIICASNKSLCQQVQLKQFREDLLYRLCVAEIHMPCLKDRGDDTADLMTYYLTQLASKQNKPVKKLTPHALNLLKNYGWPGNIRELKNLMRLLNENQKNIIDIADLPLKLRENGFQITPSIKEKNLPFLPLWRTEKQAIENAINLAQGNISCAASILDVAPSTIYRKLKSYKNL